MSVLRRAHLNDKKKKKCEICWLLPPVKLKTAKKKNEQIKKKKKNTIQAGVNLKNTNKYTHKKEGNRKTVLKKPKVKID